MAFQGIASQEIFIYDIITKFIDYLYSSYKEEGKDHILSEKDPKNRIKTELFFNREKLHTPAVYISHGEETFMNSGLGVNQGYLTEDYISAQSTIRYNIKIVTRNQIDATIIFHFIKSFLFLYMPFFDNHGFKNMKLDASPLNYGVMDELQTSDVYYTKGIDVNFEVDYQIPSFNKFKDSKGIETVFCSSIIS